MATHSSVLAWEIPGIEDPSGLQSMGLQSVGYYWAHKNTHTYLYISVSQKEALPSSFTLKIFKNKQIQIKKT